MLKRLAMSGSVSSGPVTVTCTLPTTSSRTVSKVNSCIATGSAARGTGGGAGGATTGAGGGGVGLNSEQPPISARHASSPP